MWGDDPPARVEASLQSHVARLRRALEPDRAVRGPAQRLRTHAGGYSLEVAADAVDARRFAALVREARARLATDPAEAEGLLTEGLGLWRGTAYAGTAAPSLDAEATRLDELRLAAVEDLWDVRVRGGRAGEAVGRARAAGPDPPPPGAAVGPAAPRPSTGRTGRGTPSPRCGAPASTSPTSWAWTLVPSCAGWRTSCSARTRASTRRPRPRPGPTALRPRRRRRPPSPRYRRPRRSSGGRRCSTWPRRPARGGGGPGPRRRPERRARDRQDEVRARRSPGAPSAGLPGAAAGGGRPRPARPSGAGARRSPSCWGTRRSSTRADRATSSTRRPPASGRRDALAEAVRGGPPSLLVLDDVHWADAESLRLLRRIADPAARRCRWWSSSRPGRPRPRSVPPSPRRWRRWRGSTPCAWSSAGLGPDGDRRVGRRPRGCRRDRGGRRRPWSSGPTATRFHVTELVRLLVREGALTSRDAPAWRAVPGGVRDVVRQRLAELRARLGTGARRRGGGRSFLRRRRRRPGRRRRAPTGSTTPSSRP